MMFAMRFLVDVAHPQSGREQRVLIHADSPEEARRMVNSAGLLAGSVLPASPDPSENAADSQSSGQRKDVPDPLRQPARNQHDRAESQPINLLALIPRIVTAIGVTMTVWGIVAAFVVGDRAELFATGVGLFITAVMSAYQWYWRDQAPWR